MMQYTITLEIMNELLFFYSFTLSSNKNDINKNYQPKEPPNLVYVCLMSVILQIKKSHYFWWWKTAWGGLHVADGC